MVISWLPIMLLDIRYSVVLTIVSKTNKITDLMELEERSKQTKNNKQITY